MKRTKIIIKRLFFIGLIVLTTQSWTTINRAFSQTAEVRVGSVVNGVLAAGDMQEWQLVPATSGTVYIFANRMFGDLDPIVTVFDQDGVEIARNDDRQPGIIRDAGLQLAVVAAQMYRVQVSGFAGSGLYELWVLPGFNQIIFDDTFENDTSRWVSPFATVTDTALRLNNQQVVDRFVDVAVEGAVSTEDAYVHTQFRWTTRDAATSFGVVLRSQDDDNLVPDGYYFTVNPDGVWLIERQQFGQFETLANGQLESTPQQDVWSLGALARGDEMLLFLNGQAIGEVSDDSFSAGDWGLAFAAGMAGQWVDVQRVIVTAPATPLPDFPETLDAWRSARPDEIAAELASASVIPEGGRRTYTVLDTAYQVNGTTTETYQQTEPGLRFSNMLLNVDVQFTAGDNIACGVAFRELGQPNVNIAYADNSGGTGLLDVRNGNLQQHAYDLLEPPVDPLSNEFVRLTLIIDAEYVTLYVNGQYFETHYVHPLDGDLSVALLNYSQDAAQCSFRNLWVWQ